jgi:hypothetical protein
MQSVYKNFKTQEIPHHFGRASWDPSRCPENFSLDQSAHALLWPSEPDSKIAREIKGITKLYPELFPPPETKFDIAKLFALAQGHPNQEWLKSIRSMLENGCWPKLDGVLEHDGRDIASHPYPGTQESDFVDKHIEDEIAKGMFSPATNITVPGSRFVNLFTRHQRNKDRVVSDHLYPPAFNTNMAIPDKPTNLDQVERLIPFLACYRLALEDLGLSKKYKIVLRKFDFEKAYRQIPLSHLAMIKHAIEYKGYTSYDRFLSFGMKNAGDIWGHVASIFGYIGVTLCRMICCLTFVDDINGAEIVPIDWPDSRESPGLTRFRELCPHQRWSIMAGLTALTRTLTHNFFIPKTCR